MIVTVLSDRGIPAIRDALLSHGWEGDSASAAAFGADWQAIEVRGIPTAVIQGLLPVAHRLGLEMLSGEGWLLLAGARSRLGAFARPWLQPEPLRELAEAVGRALPPTPALRWRHSGGEIALDDPVLVGVINVTPDSFSGDGNILDGAGGVARAERLVTDGAGIVDVGGESTRPGATPVPPAEERRRVIPVIEAIAAVHPTLPLSVDTVHAATAREAIRAGATIINDVTAGRHDPAILEVAAESGAGMVLSHSRGPLGELASYDRADYGGDVVGGVVRELAAAMERAIAVGVTEAQVVLDPGFGFAKTPEQSFVALGLLDALVALGRPVLIGVSRKRFLGEATGRAIEDRERATAAACAIAVDRGARLLRVHEPSEVIDAVRVAEALRRALR